MEATRRMLRILRVAMLLSIVIYGLMIYQLPVTSTPNPVIYYAIVLISISIVISLLFFRRKLVRGSEQVLMVTSDDAAALARWRTGYVLTYAFSEAIALYGVVLHFVGFSQAQVAPFLLAGFVLILFYAPRTPSLSS